MNTHAHQYRNNRLPTQPKPHSAGTTLRGVWQDNPSPQRARIASSQPASVEKVMRAHETGKNSLRLQNHSKQEKKPSKKRQTVKVTLWVKHSVRAELERIAEQGGLSISKTGAALLEKVLQMNLSTQYEALFFPLFEQMLKKHERRQNFFLSRIALETGENKRISANILRRMPKMTDTLFNNIIDACSRGARNIFTLKTPELASFMDEVESIWKRIEETVQGRRKERT